MWKKEILTLDDEGNELILPKTEQIPSDYFRKGDTIRAVVVRVEMKNNNPLIIVTNKGKINLPLFVNFNISLTLFRNFLTNYLLSNY